MHKVIEKGQPCVCPHCEAEQSEPVENYAIPMGNGRGLSETRGGAEECEECYAEFTTIQTSETTYQVDAE